MSFTVDHVPGIGEAGVRKLRHDLLNPLNVLFGMTTMLLDTELDDTQQKAVQACRNAAQKLLDIAHHLDAYEQAQRETTAGPTQLADLCSIAAARLDKPFDREALIRVIREVAPVRAPRILLVDDAPDIAMLVRAFLKDTQCSVDVVANGERAVAQASIEPYDLVLMDIDLPGLDGATAAHAIRTADLARGARPTPVVAMSAVASELQSSASQQQPKDDVVTLDDPDTAALVPGFLQNRRDDVDAMRPLIEAADFGRVQALGHRMKGTGKSYGFAEISRIGAAIELAAHQNDAVALEALANELDAYLTRVKVQSRL